jgi:F-type H+-transporting ATPase subunit alpha
MSVSQMALTLFAVNKGYMDDVEVAKVLPFESALLAFMKTKHAGLLETIESTGNLDDATEKALGAAVEEFKQTGVY